MTHPSLEAARHLLASSLPSLQRAAPTADTALLASHCCLEALMVIEDALWSADATPVEVIGHAIRLLREYRSPHSQMLTRSLRVLAGMGDTR